MEPVLGKVAKHLTDENCAEEPCLLHLNQPEAFVSSCMVRKVCHSRTSEPSARYCESALRYADRNVSLFDDRALERTKKGLGLMENLSAEEAKAQPDAKQKRRPSALAFVNPFVAGRTRSSTTIYSAPSAIENGDENDTGEVELIKARTLTRSRSEDVGPRVREEWGNELEPGLRESANVLRTSVTEYNREATAHQWKELLKINTDLTELGKLADGARKSKQNKPDDEDSADGLSKFTTVALEYSKMLDVVMNQCPEYAGLAWAAIRMLLVAHTNHSRLKHAVEHYIIQFGREFGVVNHLMSSHPTQKMVEAVTEAYAAFAKFLAKAVKYYTESRLTSAIKAFGFPWETRFEVLVKKIETTFARIKDIANAGHFGVTVQTQQMVERIGTGQETMRHEMRRSTIELRQQLKLEMRDEVQNLFQTFDRNWISRFEQIMMQSLHNHGFHDDDADGKMIPGGPKTAAIDYAASITGPSSAPISASASFLAEYVSKPTRLKRFRDKTFVHLQELDNDYIGVNARLRHTTTQDLQQIMGLLRNEKLRHWLQSSESSLVWVNTFKHVGPCDWATAFSSRIVEYASKVDQMTVLYHLCGTHPTSSQVSTATVVLQSLIMQVIEQHHQRFVRKAFPFTLEHFQDAKDDVHDLWNLFLKCCAEAKIPCAWLILDHFDNLQKDEDYEFLLRALSEIVQNDSPVFKIFVSARTTRMPEAVLDAVALEEVKSRISTIVVARTRSSMASAILSKQKRVARLPDLSPERAASSVDIDALLNSSSDESFLSEDEHHKAIPSVESPTSISVIRDPRLLELKSEDTDLDISDASMEFTRDDPFASSEDEDSNAAAAPPHNRSAQNGNTSEDEEDGFEFMKTTKVSRANLLDSDEGEDGFGGGGTSSASKSKSRGRQGPSQVSIRVTHHEDRSPFDSSDSEGS